MPSERSRSNWFTHARVWLEKSARAVAHTVAGQVADPKARKYEAIDYWDREARQLIGQGKRVRALGCWTVKQLAKAHAESRTGLALDVLSLGSGGLLVKGIQKGARAVQGAKAIRSANTMMEIDRTLRPVRKASGITRPLSKTSQRVLEGVGKAAKQVENIMPKFIQPVTVRGTKIVTPRRALKAVSKIVKGISTQTVLGGELAPRGGGPGGSLSVFLPEVITRSRHQKPPALVKPLIDSISKKPIRSVLDVGPNTPLNPKYHWVFSPELITRSQKTVPSQPSSVRLRPVAPQPGSLQWMAQGLNQPRRAFPSPLPVRSRPLGPPGSLQWMAQRLNRP